MRVPRPGRPYRLKTPTVGRVEAVRVLGMVPEPLIAWRWWARLPLVKRFARARAWQDAFDLLKVEYQGAPEEQTRPVWSFGNEPPAVSPPAPQALACELAVVSGTGTPEDWRAVRLRDALYILNLIAWRNADPKERGERPDWRRPTA